ADAVLLVVESLVDLHKGNNASLFPQERRRRLSAHLAVHRAFKEYRRDDLRAGKGRRRHDADPHLMHEPEHFGVVAVGGVWDTVEAQRTGCRSAALVKRGDEPIPIGDLGHHFVISHDCPPRAGSVHAVAADEKARISIARLTSKVPISGARRQRHLPAVATGLLTDRAAQLRSSNRSRPLMQIKVPPTRTGELLLSSRDL